MKINRYVVQYGTGRDNTHETYFDNPFVAVSFAQAKVDYPYGYLFSFVYDTQAKGECKMVWSYRDGACLEYEG